MKSFSRPLFTALLISLISGVTTAADVSLTNQTRVHFASIEEGRSLLGTKDRFISSLSSFDRQSRVEADREVSEEAFIDFVCSHARPWTDTEISKISGLIESLRPKLAKYTLPLPPSVWLIKTTGREEGDAAYCRQHSIVLPQSKVDGPHDSLERLLVHELFHILSSHNSAVREQAYKLIGFRSVPPISLPESLRDRKITNPDAPLIDAVIDVSLDGESLTAVPILYSAQQNFDPKRGGPFFKYLTFRLLVVKLVDGKWQAVEKDGEPRLLIAAKTPDYGRQIGSNTGYIIHPDEILADNFMHLIEGTAKLPSPNIIQGLQELLAAKD